MKRLTIGEIEALPEAAQDLLNELRAVPRSDLTVVSAVYQLAQYARRGTPFPEGTTLTEAIHLIYSTFYAMPVELEIQVPRMDDIVARVRRMKVGVGAALASVILGALARDRLENEKNVSVAELSALCGRDSSWIFRLIKRGTLQRATDEEITFGSAVQWLSTEGLVVKASAP